MAMNVKDIQILLSSVGAYKGSIDGIAGKDTVNAVNLVLQQHAQLLPNISAWKNSRRAIAAAQIILHNTADIEVGKIDGFIGPQTEQAYEEWKHIQKSGTRPILLRPDEQIPSGTSGKFGSQSAMDKLYGPAGGPQCTAGIVKLPYPMRIAWDRDQYITKFSCHEKVADSLQKVFERVANVYSSDEIEQIGLNIWGGCFNYRRKRGGTTLSTHAYGIAVDVDPERNQLRWKADKARLAQPDAKKFIDCWYAEGWISLGKEKNFDWMHFQAVTL